MRIPTQNCRLCKSVALLPDAHKPKKMIMFIKGELAVKAYIQRLWWMIRLITYEEMFSVFFAFATLVLEEGAETETRWRLVKHNCDKNDHA